VTVPVPDDDTAGVAVDVLLALIALSLAASLLLAVFA
jgi:hypothetical protein